MVRGGAGISPGVAGRGWAGSSERMNIHGLDAAFDAGDFWEVAVEHEIVAETAPSVQDLVWPVVRAAMGKAIAEAVGLSRQRVHRILHV